MINLDEESVQALADQKSFLIVDGHAVLYRAFHAFPDLTDPKGRQVNALYGFARLVLRAISDFQPEYVAVAFDHHGPTFRHEQFDGYKANREAMPEALRDQVALVKDFVEILNIPRYELAGYEADDLVGTATLQAEQLIKDDQTEVDRSIVLTGDSDLLQLVTDQTRVFIPKRGKFGKDMLYGPTQVVEKYSLQPTEIPQLKALVGDSSDNIPGVPGIGPKTAAKIFAQVDTIAELYDRLEKNDRVSELVSPKVAKTLLDFKAQAEMSLELATINRAAPMDFDLEACRLRKYDKAAATQFCQEYAFNSLIRLLPEDEFEQGIQSALF